MIQFTDTLSNSPEQIDAVVEALGKSTQRRAVFNAIYFGKKSIKSVGEIAASTGLSEKAVLTAGKYLSDHHVTSSVKKDGRIAYQKIGFIHKNKEKILRLVDDPKKRQAFATKRRVASAPASGINFSSPPTSKLKNGPARSSRRENNLPQLRIAFLLSNPDDEAKLRTDMELKAVSNALLRSGNRDKVSLRPYPAATFIDLLDALNEFEPQIVHFSGHGGQSGLVFDSEYNASPGGSHIDFGKVAKVIAALRKPPELLVFNACDTVDGAHVFFPDVKAVVAMSDSILDESALVFAPRFYSAIIAGQSVESAVIQGALALDALGHAGSDLATLLTSEGLDGSKLQLL